jgi:hypothetical protein
LRYRGSSAALSRSIAAEGSLGPALLLFGNSEIAPTFVKVIEQRLGGEPFSMWMNECVSEYVLARYHLASLGVSHEVPILDHVHNANEKGIRG